MNNFSNNKYRVVEKFVSVNGEGLRAGQLAVFIRFAVCNLDCSYCDTRWANTESVAHTLMTADEIYEYIKTTKVRNITLTGGEPLLQDGLGELIDLLGRDDSLYVEVETNGSVPLAPFRGAVEGKPYPSFTMDYKLPSSLMEQKMNLDNFKVLTKQDTVKFVSGSMEDLLKVKALIDEYDLVTKTNVYISPVFGNIEPADIVEFMKENNLIDVTLQIQMHKIIWDPEVKGV